MGKPLTAFEVETTRLLQIIKESADIVETTKDHRTAMKRFGDINRCATRLFEILPAGNKATLTIDGRNIESTDDLYIIEEEKNRWMDKHGFPFKTTFAPTSDDGRYRMSAEQIDRLAAMLNPAIWKTPKESLVKILAWYWTNHNEQRSDVIRYHILRSGESELSREQKKQYEIHLLAKVSSSIFEYFHESALFQCSDQSALLAQAIFSIEVEGTKLLDWKKCGIEKVQFALPSDGCDICKKLKGDYPIDNAPTVVLDTHLGCRCSYTTRARRSSRRWQNPTF
jgi:hypothetical protein